MDADKQPPGLRVSVTLHDSLPFNLRLLEIHQKTNGSARGSQVIEALCGVLVGQAFHTFQFDYRFVFDEDVGEVFSNVLPLQLIANDAWAKA